MVDESKKLANSLGSLESSILGENSVLADSFYIDTHLKKLEETIAKQELELKKLKSCSPRLEIDQSAGQVEEKLKQAEVSLKSKGEQLVRTHNATLLLNAQLTTERDITNALQKLNHQLQVDCAQAKAKCERLEEELQVYNSREHELSVGQVMKRQQELEDELTLKTEFLDKVTDVGKQKMQEVMQLVALQKAKEAEMTSALNALKGRLADVERNKRWEELSPRTQARAIEGEDHPGLRKLIAENMDLQVVVQKHTEADVQVKEVLACMQQKLISAEAELERYRSGSMDGNLSAHLDEIQAVLHEKEKEIVTLTKKVAQISQDKESEIVAVKTEAEEMMNLLRDEVGGRTQLMLQDIERERAKDELRMKHEIRRQVDKAQRKSELEMERMREQNKAELEKLREEHGKAIEQSKQEKEFELKAVRDMFKTILASKEREIQAVARQLSEAKNTVLDSRGPKGAEDADIQKLKDEIQRIREEKGEEIEEKILALQKLSQDTQGLLQGKDAEIKVLTEKVNKILIKADKDVQALKDEIKEVRDQKSEAIGGMEELEQSFTLQVEKTHSMDAELKQVWQKAEEETQKVRKQAGKDLEDLRKGHAKKLDMLQAAKDKQLMALKEAQELACTAFRIQIGDMSQKLEDMHLDKKLLEQKVKEDIKSYAQKVKEVEYEKQQLEQKLKDVLDQIAQTQEQGMLDAAKQMVQLREEMDRDFQKLRREKEAEIEAVQSKAQNVLAAKDEEITRLKGYSERDRADLLAFTEQEIHALKSEIQRVTAAKEVEVAAVRSEMQTSLQNQVMVAQKEKEQVILDLQQEMASTAKVMLQEIGQRMETEIADLTRQIQIARDEKEEEVSKWKQALDDEKKESSKKLQQMKESSEQHLKLTLDTMANEKEQAHGRGDMAIKRLMEKHALQTKELEDQLAQGKRERAEESRVMMELVQQKLQDRDDNDRSIQNLQKEVEMLKEENESLKRQPASPRAEGKSLVDLEDQVKALRQNLFDQGEELAMWRSMAKRINPNPDPNPVNGGAIMSPTDGTTAHARRQIPNRPTKLETPSFGSPLLSPSYSGTISDKKFQSPQASLQSPPARMTPGSRGMTGLGSAINLLMQIKSEKREKEKELQTSMEQIMSPRDRLISPTNPPPPGGDEAS